MHASLCVIFFVKACSILFLLGVEAWWLSNQRQRVGVETRRMCLLACVLGRIWWGTLAGPRHQPQGKLVKWPETVAVGMLQ